MAERYLCKVDVRGSIPLVSTIQNISSDHTKAPTWRGLRRSQVRHQVHRTKHHKAALAITHQHEPARDGIADVESEVASSKPQARATLAIVSSNRRLVTADQLDAMSPNERAAVLADHIVMDLEELPEGFRERVVATGKRLATERNQAATG